MKAAKEFLWIFSLYFLVKQPFCGWEKLSYIPRKWLCLPYQALKCVSRFCIDMSIIRFFQSWVAGNTDSCYLWKGKPVSHIKRARDLPLATRNIYWCFQSNDLCRKRAGFFFCRDGSFLCACITPTSCQGFFSSFFVFLNFILIFFWFLFFFFHPLQNSYGRRRHRWHSASDKYTYLCPPAMGK